MPRHNLMNAPCVSVEHQANEIRKLDCTRARDVRYLCNSMITVNASVHRVQDVDDDARVYAVCNAHRRKCEWCIVYAHILHFNFRLGIPFALVHRTVNSHRLMPSVAFEDRCGSRVRDNNRMPKKKSVRWDLGNGNNRIFL